MAIAAAAVRDCTIPRNSKALRTMIRRRMFGDEIWRRLPAIAAALIAGALSPLVLVIAPAPAAAVLLGWCLVALAVIAGQAWLSTDTPSLQTMPVEMRRLVEQNEPRIHAARLSELRGHVEGLRLEQPNFGTNVTRMLQELREATGEAFRCP